MNISSSSDKPRFPFFGQKNRAGKKKRERERERASVLRGRALTQHLIARYVGPGDAKGRIGVTVISIDSQLPVVNAPRETDAREDHAVLVTLAGRAHRVLGYGHLLRYAGCASRPREPRH